MYNSTKKSQERECSIKKSIFLEKYTFKKILCSSFVLHHIKEFPFIFIKKKQNKNVGKKIKSLK